MPRELLESDGADVRRELARLGLHISPNQYARGLLAAYIKEWPVEARARCVESSRLARQYFCYADRLVGEAEELVVFKIPMQLNPHMLESGTAEEWRECVGALAVGNTRLVFALSVALAGHWQK